MMRRFTPWWPFHLLIAGIGVYPFHCCPFTHKLCAHVLLQNGNQLVLQAPLPRTKHFGARPMSVRVQDRRGRYLWRWTWGGGEK